MSTWRRMGHTSPSSSQATSDQHPPLFCALFMGSFTPGSTPCPVLCPLPACLPLHACWQPGHAYMRELAENGALDCSATFMQTLFCATGRHAACDHDPRWLYTLQMPLGQNRDRRSRGMENRHTQQCGWALVCACPHAALPSLPTSHPCLTSL